MKRICGILLAVAISVASAGAWADWPEIPQADDPVFGPINYLTVEQPIINHGFAWDGVLQFVAQTGAPPEVTQDFGVDVYLAGTGDKIGEVPPPDRGWNRPFSVKVTADSVVRRGRRRVSGHLVVFDSLVPLEVGQEPRPAMFIEYEYSYSRRRGFEVTKLAEHALPADDPTTMPGIDPVTGEVTGLEGMVYPTEWATDTNTGRTVVADCFLAGLWVSDENMENWELTYMTQFDAPFGVKTWPADVTIDHDNDPSTPEETGIWATFPDPNWENEIVFPYAYPASPAGHFAPGLHGVEYVGPIDSFVFNSPSPTSPIGKMSAAVIYDTSTPPYAKTYEELVPAIPGITDWTGTLHWNEWKPDSPYIYWLRGLGKTSWPGMHPNNTNLPSTWYRINMFTGEMELLMSDPMLNVPSHFYPGPCPMKPLNKFFSCFSAINVCQGYLPESNKFLLPPFKPEPDWSMMPQEMPHPLYLFGEDLRHGHGHGHGGN